MTPQFERIAQRIRTYETLQEGWDGYNGIPISAESIKVACDFCYRLSQICLRFGIVPSCVTAIPICDGRMDIEMDMKSLEVCWCIDVEQDEVQVEWWRSQEESGGWMIPLKALHLVDPKAGIWKQILDARGAET